MTDYKAGNPRALGALIGPVMKRMGGKGNPGVINRMLAERINRDVVEILKSAEVSGKLKEMSLDVGATTRAETARFFAEETALWSRVIKQAGIVPQ